jgi:hypothetical protein
VLGRRVVTMFVYGWWLVHDEGQPAPVEKSTSAGYQ